MCISRSIHTYVRMSLIIANRKHVNIDDTNKNRPATILKDQLYLSLALSLSLSMYIYIQSAEMILIVYVQIDALCYTISSCCKSR